MNWCKFLTYLGPFELLHENASPRLLRYARWIVYGLWVFKLLLSPLWRLGVLPHGLYNSIGILESLSSQQRAFLFSVPSLFAVWLTCVLLCGATFIARLFPIAGTLAIPALTLYSTINRAYGYAEHTDLLLLLDSWALPLFAWADIITKKSEGDARWPLFTMVSFVWICYMLAGVNRCVTIGLNPYFDLSMEGWVMDTTVRGFYYNTGLGWYVLKYPLLDSVLHLGFPLVMAPLVFIWPKYR